MASCSVDGCLADASRKEMCNRHYRRFRKYGDAKFTKVRSSGEGTPHNKGYWTYQIDGRAVMEHVLVAERALGKLIPKGAEVHHIDENKMNNNPTNLVICPDRAYHALLHVRQRAYEACGNYNWIKCDICKRWDSPLNIKIYETSKSKWHSACLTEYNRRKHGVLFQTS